MTGLGPDPRLLRKSLGSPDYVLDIRLATITALKREGIFTLKELVARTPWELLDIRNFGQGSLRDVQQELAKIHLHLKHDEPTTQGEST